MREVTPTRTWFVAATMLLGICAMVGVLRPWAHGLELRGRSSINGFGYIQGVLAFAGALGLTVVSVLKASRRVRDIQYVAVGTAMCLLSLATSIWFWRSEVGSVDPIANSLIAFWGELPRISAGVGLYVTVAALLASLLCLIAFAVDATPRLNGIRLVHDDRNLSGGSLLPDRLRFRITSRTQTRQ